MSASQSAPETPPAPLVDFPRPGSTQHLMVTLFGELWSEPDQWVATRVIAAVATEIGATAAATQSALSRLSSRNILDQRRDGRLSLYRLTPNARARVLRGHQQIGAFRADGGQPWDRTWTVVSFSVPEDHREHRDRLRAALRWRGFALLYNGLWISPRVAVGEVEELCAESGVEDYMILTVAQEGIRGRDPLEAWDPEQITAQYEPFLQRYLPAVEKLSAGTLSDRDCFWLRLHLIDEWRGIPWSDPSLPSELLPTDAATLSASDVFATLDAGLLPGMERHARELLGRLDPTLADTVLRPVRRPAPVA